VTLILEDGTGVSGANAHTTSALVNAYLVERNRVDESGWSGFSGSEKDASVIAATDYIETRFGQRFLGRRQFQNISVARGTLTFTGQPLNTETVTIDGIVYTYNTTLGGANSVLIGASVEASIINLIDAIAATADKLGDTVGLGTVAHTTITAGEGIGDRMIAVAVAKGTPGNDVGTTETVTAASWASATLAGGSDTGEPQWLSFPRVNLFDREGLQVLGMPTKLLQATAEYAVRTVAGTKLSPDPTVDATGQIVVGSRVKVGPIETETRFSDAGSLAQLIKPYPAADRLLVGYLIPGGRVIRG
jgi:hypothetical protein